MREKDIVRFMEIIHGGRVNTRTSGNGWVQCSCPFAKWTHAGGTDSNASFGIKVNNKGPSGFNCMTCHTSGYRLHQLSWKLGVLMGRPLDRANLFVYHHEMGRYDPSMRKKGKAASDFLTTIKDPIAHMMGTTFDLMGSLSFGAHAQVRFGGVVPFGQDPPRPFVRENILANYDRSYHEYIRDRGISERVARKWGLMVERNRLVDRVVFPIRDNAGNLLAYSKRVTCARPTCQSCGYTDPEGTPKDKATIKFGSRYNPNTGNGGCPNCKSWVWPKYQHSKGFQRNYYLMGEHLVVKGRRVGILTEGNLNPIRLDQVGIVNAVATFGSKAGVRLPDPTTNLPGEQLYQAAKLFDEIVMFADGDEAGDLWAKRNESFFRANFGATIKTHVVRSPDGMDPADLRLSDRDIIELLSGYDVFGG